MPRLADKTPRKDRCKAQGYDEICVTEIMSANSLSLSQLRPLVHNPISRCLSCRFLAPQPTAFSELLGLSRTIRSLQKHNMTGKRAYFLRAEEDQNDPCENRMNELFELLTTEPAICPTA
jgi:hypothetical protein